MDGAYLRAGVCVCELATEGGNATYVACNGYNSHQNDVDNYYGKGLISKPLYEDIYAKCNFPKTYTPTGLSLIHI